MAVPTGAAAVTPAAVRPAVTLSGPGWKFMFDPQVAEDEIVQVSFSDRDWETVVVPHSFNAQDGQSIQRTMKRGAGYYRRGHPQCDPRQAILLRPARKLAFAEMRSQHVVPSPREIDRGIFKSTTGR
jgi:hypothetical protein